MNNSKRTLAKPAVVSVTLIAALVVSWIYRPENPFRNSATNGGDSLRVLFVGNSYTQYNNLQGLFAALSKAGQKNAIVGGHIIFGSQLSQHFPQIKKKLLDQRWDYVVLQEQSLIPALKKMRDEKMVPTVRQFDKQIRDSGAETVLFMTWGRRAGAARYGPDLADYYSMQEQITAGIESVGETLGVRVAPVGKAWEQVVRDNQNIQLWDKDGSHPALAGSYLAACVFYAELYGESPEGLTFYGKLSEADAKYLQVAAAQTVLGNNNSMNKSGPPR